MQLGTIEESKFHVIIIQGLRLILTNKKTPWTQLSTAKMNVLQKRTFNGALAYFASVVTPTQEMIHFSQLVLICYCHCSRTYK